MGDDWWQGTFSRFLVDVGLLEDPFDYCNYARCKTHSSGVMYIGYHGWPQLTNTKIRREDKFGDKGTRDYIFHHWHIFTKLPSMPNHRTLCNIIIRDKEWSCSHTKDPIQWYRGWIRWRWKTMISLHPTMVVLSHSWVSGPPHKMELSSPFRDLYITLSVVKFNS